MLCLTSLRHSLRLSLDEHRCGLYARFVLVQIYMKCEDRVQFLLVSFPFEALDALFPLCIVNINLRFLDR